MGTLAICPGSFDPVTIGHLDIIKRAAKMFDKVVVLVLPNAAKQSTFTPAERVDFIKRSIGDANNIEVDFYDGLLAKYAEKRGASAIVKGLRALSDFDYEFQMALTNKKINPNCDTVFLAASEGNMYISSSLVRQIGSMGGDISECVPPEILDDIRVRLKNIN